MHNIYIIKSNKLDKNFNNILYTGYFFFQFFFILSISAFARNTAIVYRVLTSLIILSFFVIIICDGYYLLRGHFSLIEICIYVVVGIIFLISFLNCKIVLALANIVFISAFKNSDYKKILKLYLYATIFAMIINVLLGVITPYTGNLTQIRYGAERVRHGLGIFHPAVCSFFYASIVMAYVVFKDRLKLIDYLIILLFDLVFFIFTDTKEPFVTVILVLIFQYILKKCNFNIIYKIFGLFTVISFIIFPILIWVLSYNYNPDNYIFSLMNRIMNSRLNWTYNALHMFGFKFFGQNVPIAAITNYHVDSSFMTLLMQQGLIVYIICLLFMSYFSYLTYKAKNVALLVVLFFISFKSFFDAGFMAVQFYPEVILFYHVLKNAEHNNGV